MNETSDQIARQIVLRTTLLLGMLPEVGEPMGQRCWDTAASLADMLGAWKRARDLEGET